MIYITGDTHIPVDTSKLSTKRFPQQKYMTKNDYLIICGDFGGVWNASNQEKYYIKWLENKNFTTLFVDGNHENFDMLNEFPVVDFCGGKAHKIRDKIYHLMRGNFFEIEGKKFYTFGGASSHDKEFRKEGKNWWKEELPTCEEIKRAQKVLETQGMQVDFVITHCAPSSVQDMVKQGYDKNILTDFFEQLKNTLTYKKWFFGHYHTDVDVDEKHCALFERVVRLEISE